MSIPLTLRAKLALTKALFDLQTWHNIALPNVNWLVFLYQHNFAEIVFTSRIKLQITPSLQTRGPLSQLQKLLQKPIRRPKVGNRYFINSVATAPAIC